MSKVKLDYTINKIVFVSIILFSSFSVSACLHTYQFKIFPVGMVSDTIITVDVKIRRTSQPEGKRMLSLAIEDGDMLDKMWILSGYISTYDKHQKLLQKESICEKYSFGEHYADSLQAIYSLGYRFAINQYCQLIEFTSDYLSFCDYQHTCEQINLLNEESENFILYQKKSYRVDILNDTTYFAYTNCRYQPKNILGLYANSIRIYRAKDVELIVSHLATGHEISMNWMTGDKAVHEARKAKGKTTILSKEYKPKVAFHSFEHPVYEEPLLHHGFGVDVFILAD